jgi:hypothetical protein
VGEGDNLFGFWQRSTIRQGNNLAEGLKEGAFGRRPEQRRGNALAHDVADDDIEEPVNMPEKVIEVAADPLRGNRKRRHMRPGEIPRRLIEKQRLLNLEADLDLSLSLSRRQFFRLPAFCNIPGDL